MGKSLLNILPIYLLLQKLSCFIPQLFLDVLTFLASYKCRYTTVEC